ncbi:MAG: hypothetical protein F6K65_32360 [Moorea sp. SIO3C2]|nr:hypothetical protein [Moorena sp. SIO3C2]
MTGGWNGHLGGMGILVEWASWWNGHLARYNFFRAGCPNAPKALYTLHPTPYSLKEFVTKVFKICYN